MSSDLTFWGQVVFFSAIIIAGASFVLGKRKTSTPIMAGVVGFLTGLVPPIGLIFLAVLVVKKDIN